jgi:aryl-alcohol dehydrogenase-like predicted oxidoreductase
MMVCSYITAFAAWQVADAMSVAKALGSEPLVRMEPEHGMRKRTIEKELLPYGRAVLRKEESEVEIK